MHSKRQRIRESEIAMHLAIRNHRVDEVAQRLKDGASANAFDDTTLLTGTPLALTALCTAVAAAAHAISPERAAVAEVNIALSPSLPPDDVEAERARSLQIIRLLLSSGADPNLPTLCRSPLSLAAAAGDGEVVEILLAAGADPAGPCWSPLSRLPGDKQRVGLAERPGFHSNAIHEAAQKGHVEVVRLLCEGGANPSARNHEGKTALDLAREKDHINVVRTLQRYAPQGD
jgi:hypothetical protein